jgi:ankyrin repeat protein
VSIVNLLISAGSDIDVRNSDGSSALKLAREHKKEQIIALLKEAGAEE